MENKSTFWSFEMSNGFKRFLIFHLPAILFMVLIYYVSSLHTVSPPSIGFSMEDKFYHFAEYAVLSFFLHHALRYYRQQSIRGKIHIIAAAIACLFAATDELHQYFVPGRESTIGDLTADWLGAILTQVVIWYYLKLRRQKSID